MLNLVWITDTHFTLGEPVYGYDPLARLNAAISYINAFHAEASYCVHSGDMADRGHATVYRSLADRLKALSVPLLPMLGNHDERSSFRAHFTLPETCMEHFVQYTVETSEGFIVCLDTVRQDSAVGEFCAERKNWLEKVLRHADQKPVYIFMHHPPMSIGHPLLDPIMLDEGEDFLRLIKQYDNVKYLFIGHVHAQITGTLAGIPFATMSSTLHQTPPPQPGQSWENFTPAPEAPRLGVLNIHHADVMIHYRQFCPFALGHEDSVSVSTGNEIINNARVGQG